MHRLRILMVMLLAVALLGLSGVWAATATTSGETTVYWNAVCWIGLAVHPDVNLGTIDASAFATGYLESTGNAVTVHTNCVSGYTLESEAIATTTPTGFTGNILADFYWWVNGVTGPNLDFVQNSETNFTALNTKELVARSLHPATHHFDMGYKYYIDTDDIPGNYSVTIRYTVTSL